MNYLLDLANEYGDIVHIRAGLKHIFFINHPEYVKHVLQSGSDHFTKKSFIYDRMRRVFRQGLVTSEGEVWRRERRVIQPAFHQKSLERFSSVMTHCIDQKLRRWDFFAQSSKTIDVGEEVNDLTLQMTGKVLFGYDMQSDLQIIDRSVAVGSDYLSKTSVFVPPYWLPVQLNRRLKKNLADLDSVIVKIIAQRRDSQRSHFDLLDMLLRTEMSDDLLIDEIRTMIVAGHVTTADALTWTIFLLATNPETRIRLREEMSRVMPEPSSPKDLDRLTQTRMAINEAMRLYPPVWSIWYQAARNCSIGEYTVPAKSAILISPYTLHRHPGFWKDAELFQPERFLPENAAARHMFAYIPFGGGPRRCIGKNLAIAQMMLVLSCLVRNFDFELVSPHPSEFRTSVTLKPSGKILLRLKPRAN